jgi:isoamylase
MCPGRASFFGVGVGSRGETFRHQQSWVTRRSDDGLAGDRAGSGTAERRIVARVRNGSSWPIGATLLGGGVNFSVYSKHSTELQLLLFDHVDDERPARVVPLDPAKHRSYHYWHVFVPDLKPGQVYGYRARGPRAPERGLTYDPDKVLLDPYARLLAIPRRYDRRAAIRPGENFAESLKSVVVDTTSYDWEGDKPLNRPFVGTVIYELHVGGFTRRANSGVAAEKRGTYAGLIEKIPYLVDLGITAVELLPVFQFEVDDAVVGTNYWGYSPIAFFAPHRQYSSRQDLMGPLDEFRDLVKALHRAGIEVILDVVFNHTSEGDERGPTQSFRGLDNPTYYVLEKGKYSNFSGTGNTLHTNHAVVRRLIQDSLRYWVREMHVDGFRFDLASILARDGTGRMLDYPTTLWSIETDPELVDTKLIAEPWDAGGLYQVGTFVGDRWKEWNGRFRDDVRAFVRGDEGAVAAMPNRIMASPDLYGHKELDPEQTVNFVTCHDGFTLNDLVSYNSKHNEANGEGNRDGADHNLSWNCGVEGPTDDPAVERLRNRQAKNLLLLTLTSIGVPMLLMGDEVRRTQLGNNNAYCQDSELSWFDWSLLERHADLHRFVKLLVEWRLHETPERDPRLTLSQFLLSSRIEWHGVELNRPDFSPQSHSFAVSAHGRRGHMHLMFNSYWEALSFELPPRQSGAWRRIADTALESPHDISPLSEAPALSDWRYLVQARSAVMLVE